MLNVTRFTVPCFNSGHVRRKVRMGLVAHVHPARSQRKLPVEIQVAVLLTSTLHTMASVNPEFSISVMFFAAFL